MKMVNQAETFVAKCFQKVGIQVTRYRPLRTSTGRLTTALKANRIDFVIDVGANVGQFAMDLRNGGYSGRILSFEPIEHCHRIIQKQALKDPAWTIAPRMALSNEDSIATIYVSENSVSSSLLAMHSRHSEAAPDSKYIGQESTEVRRLDTVAPQMLPSGCRCLLKIDAQGAEALILEGAKETLSRLVGLKIEVSLWPLYEGAPDYLSLLQNIRDLGFDIWALEPGFVDSDTGKMLQVDGVFFRSS